MEFPNFAGDDNAGSLSPPLLRASSRELVQHVAASSSKRSPRAFGGRGVWETDVVLAAGLGRGEDVPETFGTSSSSRAPRQLVDSVRRQLWPDAQARDAKRLRVVHTASSDLPISVNVSPLDDATTVGTRVKLCVVAGALDSTPGQPESCKRMLRFLVAGCLGPGRDARDDIQRDGCVMVRDALDTIQANLEQRIRDCEDRCGKLQSTALEVSASLRRAEQKLEAESMRRKIEQLSIVEDRCVSAQRKAAKLGERMPLLEGALFLAAREMEAFEDLYHGHMQPLVEERVFQQDRARDHLSVVLPLLERWGVEDCLLVAFRLAAQEIPARRGRWCGTSMAKVDELFQTVRSRLRKHWESCAIALKQQREEIHKDSEECHMVEQEYAMALATLRQGCVAESTAAAALTSVLTAAGEVQSAKASAERELQQARGELSQFRTGPLTAFEWLLEHTGEERLEYRTAASGAGNLDARQAALVQTVIDGLSEGPQKSPAYVEMLREMIIGSLATPPSERGSFQKRAIKSLSIKLSARAQGMAAEIESEVQKYSGQLGNVLNSHALGGSFLETLLTERTSSIHEAEHRLQEAALVRRNAQSDLTIAEANLLQASADEKGFYDVFDSTYVPLRDARCTSQADAALRIASLTPLLTEWECEDSLQAGLLEALRHPPEDRCSFGAKCIREAEAFFTRPKRELEAMRLACTRAVEEATRAVQRSESAYNHAAKTLADTKMDCIALEHVRPMVAKLSELRHGALAAMAELEGGGGARRM